MAELSDKEIKIFSPEGINAQRRRARKVGADIFTTEQIDLSKEGEERREVPLTTSENLPPQGRVTGIKINATAKQFGEMIKLSQRSTKG